MQKSKVIRGYAVSLDTDTEGHGENHPERVSGCWIQKGNYSASLECASGQGILEDSRCRVIDISDEAVEEIRKWAETNGY